MSFYKYWLSGKNLIIPVVCAAMVIGGVLWLWVCPDDGGEIVYMVGLAVGILDCARSKKRYNEIYGSQ